MEGSCELLQLKGVVEVRMCFKKRLPGFDPQYHSGTKSGSFGLQP